ncbi:MAG: DUF3089 domain-containing protein [Pseudomonadota bacterium]
MAKKFLYLVAFCLVVFIVGRIGYEMFQEDIARIALVPSAEFEPQEALADNAYEDPAMWYSRPGMGTSDPARWQPAFRAPLEDEAGDNDTADGDAASVPTLAGTEQASASTSDFAVFFVHPTSYLNRASWNAPVGDNADPEAERIAQVFVRGMASPFNAANEIWAPRYRQATFGAFLTDAPEGQQAIDAAYADVKEAFAYFLSSIDGDTPIVLAGHSQGSLHLIRLLREELNGSPNAQRLIAAYIVGWPVSVPHDLPAMGFPACASADQTGCLISWSSFAEPADPSSVIETYANSTGFDGTVRGTSEILCTNPLTGQLGGDAEMTANLGTLVPQDDLSGGELVPEAVPARCDDRGLLLIGDPPELGPYVLPGNNYHVYDIPLFWANTQADVNRRVAAFAGGAISSDAPEQAN